MLIKSVKLENIRSYLKEEVNFSDSSTLLAGDIGSGKSTILLAIEFALFGICGKALPGDALLRNGKNSGSVELRFDVEGKDIIIKRCLKRMKDAVTQSAGYIVVDGVKKDKTPVELKAVVLELLGYPKELLTKTKNLVYRFTVYTPQEEMKQILIEPAELRIDTLRKVFGIDKYKNIRENSLIYAKELKEKIKEFKGETADIEEKKALKKEYEKEADEIKRKIKGLEPGLQKLKALISGKKASMEKSEQDAKKLNELKNEASKLDVELRIKAEQGKRNKADIERIDAQIKDIKDELLKEAVPDIEELRKSLAEKQAEMAKKEKLLREIAAKISENNSVIKIAEATKQKILSYAKCPTCEQEVSKEHKESIFSRENSRIEEAKNNVNAQKEHDVLEQERLNQLKYEYDCLQIKEAEIRVAKLKQQNLKEKEKQVHELNVLQEQAKKSIELANERKAELGKIIEKYSGIDEDYKKIKQELDRLQMQEKQVEMEKAGLEREKFQIEKTMAVVDAEISRKIKTKQMIEHYSQLQNWLEEYFANLMTVIEKHIMAKAHYDFNEVFQHWFKMLIEDEAINVRLDDDFTPIVEQNGYETSVDFLSGGERTAAALAYRLALNKVINSLMSAIKTKDLIILDEPTDGFSTEQLDRVRDVLEQINARQLIIVSHETKIETFVDNILRVSKHEHTSEIGV